MIYRTTVYRIYPAQPLKSGPIPLPKREGKLVQIGEEWMIIRYHRTLPGRPVKAYIKQDGRKAYLHLTSIQEEIQSGTPSNPIGIDIGLGDHFVILSDGTKIPRCAATGKSGKRARKDWRNKLANTLTRQYDFIAVETLSLDRGDVSAFLIQLELKCKERGVGFTKVGKWYPSSKLCHVCGAKNDSLTLDQREWTCPSCGTRHDRDENAAKNILTEGLRLSN